MMMMMIFYGIISHALNKQNKTNESKYFSKMQQVLVMIGFGIFMEKMNHVRV